MPIAVVLQTSVQVEQLMVLLKVNLRPQNMSLISPSATAYLSNIAVHTQLYLKMTAAVA